MDLLILRNCHISTVVEDDIVVEDDTVVIDFDSTLPVAIGVDVSCIDNT